jgi:cytochrome c-type biogenesis protein
MEDLPLLAAGLTALAAGLLSFLSPCVLPLMPAYLSFVSGLSVEELREGRGSPPAEGAEGAKGAGAAGRIDPAMIGALGFVAGFSLVFIAIGASASAIGHVITAFRFEFLGFVITPAQIAGVVVVLFGLHLLGLLRIPALYREHRFAPGKGSGGAPRAMLLGGAFAFGWTPCIGPVLAGILTLAAGQETLLHGVALLALYSLGLGIPFLLTALSLDRFYRFYAQARRHFRAIELVSGGLLVAVGVLIATNQLVRFNSYFTFLEGLVIGLEEKLL